MPKPITTENKNIYRDFDLNFSNNPLTNDLTVKNDIQSINQSLKNLISTNLYERPFYPQIGSNIRNILFEPVDTITLLDLQDAIKYTIQNYEKRVRLIGVIAEDLPDQNSYRVQIRYEIRSSQYTTTFDTVLKRLR